MVVGLRCRGGSDVSGIETQEWRARQIGQCAKDGVGYSGENLRFLKEKAATLNDQLPGAPVPTVKTINFWDGDFGTAH